MSRWTADDIPDQTGRVIVITGANAGLGFASAKALAHRGARVIMACRDPQRGQTARDRIAADEPARSVELMALDLANLKSVETFAGALHGAVGHVDVLMNNAGVMIPPFGRTEDGFELQIGVNFLGHFALTGRVLDLLEAAPAARVVTLSSLAHVGARIDLDSFAGEKKYRAWRAYQQSKLACLLFARALQRRLSAADSTVTSYAAHPGGTRTDLQRHSGFLAFATRFAMSADQGALPQIFAATAPEAEPGGYYGPGGLAEVWGYPKKAFVAGAAKDEDVAQRLWAAAEDATGVRYLG